MLDKKFENGTKLKIKVWTKLKVEQKLKKGQN